MDVFYFPFTYMPEKSIAALRPLFKKLIFFQTDEMFLPDAMKSSVADGDVVMSIPVPGQGKKIVEMLSIFRNWGQSLDGKNRKYFKVQNEEIPFFSDMSVSKIKSDLSKGTLSKGKASESVPKSLTPEDIVSQAGLFLQLAQDLDVESEEVETGLRKYLEMENVLFDEIKGGAQEDDLNFSASLGDPTPGGTREDNLESRLAAWSILFRYVENCDGVFVTDSEAVFRHLEEKGGIGEAICRLPVPGDMSDPSAFQTTVEDLLLQLSRGGVDTADMERVVLPEDQGALTTSMLEVYVVQGVPPRNFFADMMPKNFVPEEADMDSDHTKMNTVLCLIRQNP